MYSLDRSNASKPEGEKKMKKCPVCKSESWDYDVVTADGTSFCGDCFFELKRRAKNFGYSILKNNLHEVYLQALKATIKEYKKLHNDLV